MLLTGRPVLRRCSCPALDIAGMPPTTWNPRSDLFLFGAPTNTVLFRSFTALVSKPFAMDALERKVSPPPLDAPLLDALPACRPLIPVFLYLAEYLPWDEFHNLMDRGVIHRPGSIETHSCGIRKYGDHVHLHPVLKQMVEARDRSSKCGWWNPRARSRICIVAAHPCGGPAPIFLALLLGSWAALMAYVENTS